MIGSLVVLGILIGVASWLGGLESRIDGLERDVKGLTARVAQYDKDAKGDHRSGPCDKIIADLNDALARDDSDEANRQDELAFKFNCGLTPVSTAPTPGKK